MRWVLLTFFVTTLLALPWLDFAGSAASAQAAAPRVTLQLKNVEIRSALRQLFEPHRLKFSLDDAVQGTVSLTATDIPLEAALRALLRSYTANRLTYTVQIGEYRIGPAQPGAPAEPAAPPSTGGAATPPTPATARRTGRTWSGPGGGRNTR